MDTCQPSAAAAQEPMEDGLDAKTAGAASPEDALDVALAWAEGRRHRRVGEALRQADADAEELRAALAARMSEMAAGFARQLEEERSAHEAQVAALEQTRDKAIARAALAEVAQATAQRRLERAVTLLGARTRHTVSDPLVVCEGSQIRAPTIRHDANALLVTHVDRRTPCSRAALLCSRS